MTGIVLYARDVLRALNRIADAQETLAKISKHSYVSSAKRALVASWAKDEDREEAKSTIDVFGERAP